MVVAVSQIEGGKVDDAIGKAVGLMERAGFRCGRLVGLTTQWALENGSSYL